MDAWDKDAIAIVGIGCRFPGRVQDVDTFWSLLMEGRSGIREVPADRWNVARFHHPDRSVPGKLVTPRGGYLDRIDQFDASFFGISPREASRMDPQQRWLLEVAWEALEDAGVAPSTLKGSQTGVFVGISAFDYATMQTTNRRGVDVHSASGMALSIASNRLSYWFDLRGPSLSVDTACSSALVALHLACESIRNGETEMALAGGVNALITPGASVAFSKAGMLSPDGECYAFDSRANGFVRAEGAGLVFIKRLTQALADQDRIYAVIRSTASNQDGRTPAMAVPGEAAQIALLQDVYEKAGIDPAHVAYMEAHGTGTPVGDPIETSAIGKVLAKGRASQVPCRIGSVKTNIGHLESASGIAGVIKAALVLDRMTIPPNRNFEKPNPNIPFDDLNLRVVTKAEPLLIDGCRPIVGVNSFGFGGTNAHAALEAAPSPTAATRAKVTLIERPFVLPLSARDDVALRALAQKFRRYLATNHGPLGDICYSAGARREHHPNRLVVSGRDSAELRQKLDAWLTSQSSEPGITVGSAAEQQAERITFVYSGQGGQWWRMGRDLLQREPIFRAAVEEIDAALSKYAKWSLREEFLRDEQDSNIHRTDIAQPAIFALQVGLTRLWKSWGILPQQVIGHSVGEVAAALAAGVLNLEDAVKVIFHRSRLQHQTAGNGEMAAVGLSEEKARAIVANAGATLEVAAVNSPSLVTLAGDAATLGSVLGTLESEGVFVRRLPIDYAFHTYQMDIIHGELLASLADIRPVSGKIPIISTVTGAEIDGSRMGAEYWWSNVRQPVRFAQGIESCVKAGAQAFVEVGPHASMESSIRECVAKSGSTAVIVNSLRRETDESVELLQNLARLHLAGVNINWANVNQSDGQFVRLPSYPWNWKSHWLQSTESKNDLLDPEVTALLGVQVLAAMPTWESEPDPRRFEYLQDHRIWNNVIFPAAAFADIALALVRHLHPDGTHVVEDLKIEKALFLSTDGIQLLHTVYNESESSFTIFSSDEDRIKWERHASGHITKMPAAETQAMSIEALQSQLPDSIDREEVYRNFSEAGFQFGGRFQNIHKLWRGAEQSLAEIVAPDSITASLASSCFHPALLDACFQATTGLLPAGSTGLPADIFLPASVQRIQMYCPQIPRHFYARAINARWQDDSITADIFVYGVEGEPIAEILGFRAEKFAQRRAAGDIPVGIYQYKWRPGHLWGARGGDAANLAQPHDIAAAARERVPEVSAKYETDRLVHEYLPLSERVVCLYIENAYRKLKWAPSDEFGLDEAVAGFGAVERYRGLIKVQLDAIARYTGAVTALADERWRVNRSWTDEDAGEALDKLRKAFPSSEAESILLAAAGPHFADILCGIVDPLNVLFPGGSSELVEPFYSRSAAGRAYNDLVQTAVTAALKAVPERRAIRILEVGGGTGSLTRGILPILPSHKTEYTFTDLSPAFFAAARQHFSKFPFVKYQSFDIERSPKGQDIRAAGYDIIVASDVIHATRSLADTLDNLKECLAPGGILLFLELSRSLALIENTFGLLEGWWKFSDFRTYSPILSPDGWRQVLLKQGFEDVQSFVNITGNESDAVQAVHVARAPETLPAAEQIISSIGGLLGKNKSELNDRVVVFADRNGVGAAVAKELQAQGLQTLVVQSQEATGTDDSALQIDPASEEAIGAFFSEHFPAGASPLAVVDCWSLDNPVPALADDNAEILVSQVKGVQHLRRLLRVVVQQWPKTLPKLAVVTRGGQCVHEAEGIDRIDSAPIVGFLRVARNEFPEASCLHIDLDTAADSHEIEDLIAELTLANAEGEIALRRGRRYVHRLHEINEDALALHLSDARRPDGSLTPYRLELGKPGSLNNVSLNACARRSPARDEMEVEIKAAGINFRDLMKTLGMYPWKPGEVRMLGDDFSGVVTRIGKDVTQFSVGDAVFGSTVAAFSSHAIVRPEMVGRKADFISFAEAAGLPSVFLTAHYALVHLARMQPKERVLIHSGAGGVGQAAIQVAKALGLEIFATAGTPERRQLLKDLGADHAMDSRSLRFADDVMAATNGEGVDAVLNSLSGDFIAKNLSVLAPFGRMIEIGKIDIYGNTKIGLSPFRKNISFFALDLDLVINKKPALAIELAREVNEKIATGVYKPLPYHSFPVTEASDALRLMAQAKHVGKIILDFDLASIPIASAKDDSTFFRPDAFYLVTGGASGVGLELVRWMQQCGARHFALLSRSGPRDERDIQAIEELRVAGAEVLDIRGDVTSRDDVIRAVEKANRPDAPLRGIFHCAMVLNDQFISELDDEQFNRTFHPKMVGAWNLHVASRDLPLDQFVCFSSFSSAVGLPRQANYNAGNSFLGALATYRRAKGLPGLTIEWGAIQGAGTLERESKVGQFLGQLGVQGIALVELFQKLRYALTRDAGVVAFAKMDWTKLASLVPQIRAGKTFELVSVTRAKRRGGGWVRDELANVGSHGEARDILVNYLTARVAEILGTDAGSIEILKPFSQLGIDSLMAVELVQSVEADLDLTLGMGAILGGSRLTDLADSLARKLRSDLNADDHADDGMSDAEVIEQMVDDCQLADSIHFPRGLGRRSANGRILLTGATGFLGAYVLKELLLRETSEIVCIVRADAGEAGVDRISDNLKRYGLLDDEIALRKRVKVVLGDLAKPRFGLTQEEFDGLATCVDAVYHLAAQVNHLLDYRSLRDGNVLSAKHVLEFAAAADHRIEVHYASSLAILSTNKASGSAAVTELDPLSDYPDLTSGYVQTKWVSEHLFIAARERGCPVTIYRFGLITGDERVGTSNPTDFLWRSVKAMLDLKKAPNSNSLLYITPADFAARAMVALSLRKDAEQQTYHIVGDISTGLSDVLEIAQRAGLNAVDLIPVDEWIAMISNRLHDADVQSIAPYLAAYPEGLQIAVSPIMEIMRFPVVANALTGEKLAEEGIAMNSDTPDLVALYINDLTGIGYFERA